MFLLALDKIRDTSQHLHYDMSRLTRSLCVKSCTFRKHILTVLNELWFGSCGCTHNSEERRSLGSIGPASGNAYLTPEPQVQLVDAAIQEGASEPLMSLATRTIPRPLTPERVPAVATPVTAPSTSTKKPKKIPTRTRVWAQVPQDDEKFLLECYKQKIPDTITLEQYTRFYAQTKTKAQLRTVINRLWKNSVVKRYLGGRADRRKEAKPWFNNEDGARLECQNMADDIQRSSNMNGLADSLSRRALARDEDDRSSHARRNRQLHIVQSVENPTDMSGTRREQCTTGENQEPTRQIQGERESRTVEAVNGSNRPLGDPQVLLPTDRTSRQLQATSTPASKKGKRRDNVDNGEGSSTGITRSRTSWLPERPEARGPTFARMDRLGDISDVQ